MLGKEMREVDERGGGEPEKEKESGGKERPSGAWQRLRLGGDRGETIPARRTKNRPRQNDYERAEKAEMQAEEHKERENRTEKKAEPETGKIKEKRARRRSCGASQGALLELDTGIMKERRQQDARGGRGGGEKEEMDGRGKKERESLRNETRPNSGRGEPTKNPGRNRILEHPWARWTRRESSKKQATKRRKIGKWGNGSRWRQGKRKSWGKRKKGRGHGKSTNIIGRGAI